MSAPASPAMTVRSNQEDQDVPAGSDGFVCIESVADTSAAETGPELAAKAPDAEPSAPTVTISLKTTDGRTVEIAAQDLAAALASGQTLDSVVASLGAQLHVSDAVTPSSAAPSIAPPATVEDEPETVDESARKDEGPAKSPQDLARIRILIDAKQTSLSEFSKTHQERERNAKTAKQNREEAQNALEQSCTEYDETLDRLSKLYTDAAKVCGRQKWRMGLLANVCRETISTQTDQVDDRNAHLNSITEYRIKVEEGENNLKDANTSHQTCLADVVKIRVKIQDNAIALNKATLLQQGADEELIKSGYLLENLQKELHSLRQELAALKQQ